MVMSTQQESETGFDAIDRDEQASDQGPEQAPALQHAFQAEPQPQYELEHVWQRDRPLQLEHEPDPAPEISIPVAEDAPLVPVQAPAPPAPNELLGLPLQLLNQLLASLGKTRLGTLVELLPALRLLSLLALAGVTLKLTGATLGAINDIPMMGRLLELVGLISALNFLSRNALKSQQRAQLMTRIRKLKREYFG